VPFLIPDDYWRRTLAGRRGRRLVVGLVEPAGAMETRVGELAELRSTTLVLAGPESAQVIPYRNVRSVEVASEREEVSECRTDGGAHAVTGVSGTRTATARTAGRSVTRREPVSELRQGLGGRAAGTVGRVPRVRPALRLSGTVRACQ
jgi:hypothetical protein